MATNRNEKDGGHPPPRSKRIAPIGQIRLTPLTPQDLDQILDIENQCYPNPWSKESFIEVIRDTRTFGTLAARSQKKLMGYIISSEVVDELHILNLAIDPQFQRNGIATMMLMHLHQAALGRKRSLSYLEVRATNARAQKLYEKFGYKPLGRRKDYYSDTHEDAILMIAHLSQKP